MSKKNADLSIDKINEGLYADHLGMSTTPINREEAFEFFEAADDKSFETLGGGEYLNWDKMKEGTYVFIFTGTTTWVDNSPFGKGETVTAVKLEDKEGKEWICAAKLIVDALLLVTQLPCMIRVNYKGKKAAKSGNKFFDLSVQVSKGVIAGKSGE